MHYTCQFSTTERHRAAKAHAGSCPDPPSTQHAPGHRQNGPHCLLRPKIGHVGSLTPTVLKSTWWKQLRIQRSVGMNHQTLILLLKSSQLHKQAADSHLCHLIPGLCRHLGQDLQRYSQNWTFTAKRDAWHSLLWYVVIQSLSLSPNIIKHMILTHLCLNWFTGKQCWMAPPTGELRFVVHLSGITPSRCLPTMFSLITHNALILPWSDSGC